MRRAGGSQRWPGVSSVSSVAPSANAQRVPNPSTVFCGSTSHSNAKSHGAGAAGGTLDRTLRRKPGIVRGSVPPAAPAPWELALEWDVLPQNTVDGLGTR